MFFIAPFCSTRRKATKALNNSSNVIPPRLLERRHTFHTVFSINLMTRTWSPEVLESSTSGIVCLQSPSCRVPRRRRLKDTMGTGDENVVPPLQRWKDWALAFACDGQGTSKGELQTDTQGQLGAREEKKSARRKFASASIGRLMICHARTFSSLFD